MTKLLLILIIFFSQAVGALHAHAQLFSSPLKVDLQSKVRPDSVVVGDFNGDFITDMAVPNTFDNSVSVLLGNGDGTFKGEQMIAVGAGPVAVVVADFNGDQILDLP